MLNSAPSRVGPRSPEESPPAKPSARAEPGFRVAGLLPVRSDHRTGLCTRPAWRTAAWGMVAILGLVGCIRPKLCEQDGQCQPCERCVNGGCVESTHDANGQPLMVACYTGSPATRGIGACHSGTRNCLAIQQGAPCLGEIRPQAEICDGLDNDCNGQTDEPFQTGLPCTAGMGLCLGIGTWVCTEDQLTARCNAVAGASVCERCGNGLDDDCDGEIDEGFDLGQSCVMGVGACRVEGVLRCADDGLTSICTATPGAPASEICNGVDDDCDGQVDEGYALGECAVGEGDCRRQGERVCNAAGDSTLCNVDPGPPGVEQCGGGDEDCDGIVNEGFDVGGTCIVGTGACRRAGTTLCNQSRTGTLCSVQPGAPVSELCNGIDDDCDGAVDEPFPIGEACTTPDLLGACLGHGVLVCDDSMVSVRCDAVAGAPAVEDTTCDGIDDDCDGDVDEDPQSRVCGDNGQGRQQRFCGDPRGWLPADCEDGVCRNGELEEERCGPSDLGVATRTCVSGDWSDWTCCECCSFTDPCDPRRPQYVVNLEDANAVWEVKGCVGDNGRGGTMEPCDDASEDASVQCPEGYRSCSRGFDPQKVLTLNIVQPGEYRFDVASDVAAGPHALNSVLYLRSVCDDVQSELACAVQGDDGVSQLSYTFDEEAGSSVTAVVESGAGGEFGLTIERVR